MWGVRRELPAETGEQAAAELANYLSTGGQLVPIPVDGLVLGKGEAAIADVGCSTARFYGTKVVYPRGHAGYFENHPTFGQRWVPNRRLDARRRQEAEAAACEQWREHASARVVLTSVGVRHNRAGISAWLPFDHELLVDASVPLGESTAVLSYSVCPPLLLAGPAAPWLGTAIRHLTQQSA